MLDAIFGDHAQSVWGKENTSHIEPPLSAFPRIDASILEQEFETNLSFLAVRLRPKVERVRVLKERLIHNLWSVLAQSGGACSFYAGVTFTVIAELIDSFYLFLTRHRLEQLEMKETRTSTFGTS